MKKLIIASNIIIFNSCINLPTPKVNLISESIQNETNSYEYFRIKALSRELKKLNIPTIYLHPALTENQTGLPIISQTFAMMLSSAAQDLAPSIEVYLMRNSFDTIVEDSNKKQRAFMMFGALTAYNKDYTSISKGFDFGITWGKGRGESDYDSQFRDTDDVSTMTLDLLFAQNGKIYTKSTGTIKIHRVNRGYDFGLSINGSGIGANAYTTKSEGIHQSIRRLLHNALYVMIRDIVEKQHLIKNSNSISVATSKLGRNDFRSINNIEYATPVDKFPSRARMSDVSRDSIDEAENQFLNSLE